MTNGKLIDSFIEHFYRIGNYPNFCKKYTICSCAHETSITIKFNSRLFFYALIEEDYIVQSYVQKTNLLSSKKHYLPSFEKENKKINKLNFIEKIKLLAKETNDILKTTKSR